jgi:hypothetical protein
MSCASRHVTASNRIFFSGGNCGGGDCEVSGSTGFAFSATAPLLAFFLHSLALPTIAFGVIHVAEDESIGHSLTDHEPIEYGRLGEKRACTS